MIIFLPIPLILQLNLRISKKISVVILICIGFMYDHQFLSCTLLIVISAVIASMVRLKYVVRYSRGENEDCTRRPHLFERRLLFANEI